MKKSAKRIVALLLAMLLLLGLVGCGAKTEEQAPTETTNEPAESNNTAAETPAANESTAEEPAAEEPYEIHVFLPGFTGEENSPETELYITRAMEEALNIKVVFEEVPASSYDEKLSLSLADGDYPDVYLFNTHEDSNLKRAAENGVIIPINDYLDGMDNINAYTYESAFNAAKILNDDNIYLLPRTSVARSDGFIVRSDWMENLGITVDNDDRSMTPDEFLDMMRRFTEEDPDGDGVDNTYGYIFRATDGILTPIFTGAFGCYGWQESDGEYQYMNPCYEIGNESYKQALEFNRELYKYSHPDSAVTSDWHSLLWNGSTGCASEFAGWLLTNQAGIQEINPDGTLTYIGGVSDENGVLKNVAGGVGIWGGWAITTACEHPEKVMEMFDWLLSDEGWEYILYGIPGKTYEKDDSGKITVNVEAMKENDRGIYNSVARRAGDGNYFIDKTLDEESRAQLLSFIDISCETAVFPLDSGKIPDISSDLQFMEVEAKRKEVETKIIMGTMDISEYDKVLEEWYQKGGATYVEQMNELISAIQ